MKLLTRRQLLELSAVVSAGVMATGCKPVTRPAEGAAAAPAATENPFAAFDGK